MSIQLPVVASVDQITEHDIVVVIIGHPGVGRSTFINSAVGGQILPVRRSPHKVETRDFQYAKCLVQADNQTERVILVEVPALQVIGDRQLKSWLRKLSLRGIRITGVVYLIRMTNGIPSFEPLQMLERLCWEATMVFPTLVTVIATAVSVESQMDKLQKIWEIQHWAKRGPLSQVMRFDKDSPNLAMDMICSLIREKDGWEVMKRKIENEREAREIAERDAKQVRGLLEMEYQRHSREEVEYQKRVRMEQDKRQELEHEVREVRNREQEGLRAREREVREAKEARKRESEERKERERLEGDLERTNRVLQQGRLFAKKAKERVEEETQRAAEALKRAEESELKLKSQMDELYDTKHKLRISQEKLGTMGESLRKAGGELGIIPGGDLNTGRRDKLGSLEDEVASLKTQLEEKEVRIAEALAHEMRVWDERINKARDRLEADLAVQTDGAITLLRKAWSVKKREAVEQEHTIWKKKHNSPEFEGTLDTEKQQNVVDLMRELNDNLDKVKREWAASAKRAEEMEREERKKIVYEEIKRRMLEWTLEKKLALEPLEGLLRE